MYINYYFRFQRVSRSLIILVLSDQFYLIFFLNTNVQNVKSFLIRVSKWANLLFFMHFRVAHFSITITCQFQEIKFFFQHFTYTFWFSILYISFLKMYNLFMRHYFPQTFSTQDFQSKIQVTQLVDLKTILKCTIKSNIFLLKTTQNEILSILGGIIIKD